MEANSKHAQTHIDRDKEKYFLLLDLNWIIFLFFSMNRNGVCLILKRSEVFAVFARGLSMEFAILFVFGGYSVGRRWDCFVAIVEIPKNFSPQFGSILAVLRASFEQRDYANYVGRWKKTGDFIVFNLTLLTLTWFHLVSPRICLCPLTVRPLQLKLIKRRSDPIRPLLAVPVNAVHIAFHQLDRNLSQCERHISLSHTHNTRMNM